MVLPHRSSSAQGASVYNAEGSSWEGGKVGIFYTRWMLHEAAAADDHLPTGLSS